MLYEILKPGKLIAGENSITLIPKEVKLLKGTYPLIVTDPGIAKSGLLNRLISIFDAEKIKYKIFSEVESDPDISVMEKGKEVASEEQHDIIITFGGGSSIDTGKVISFLVKNEGRVRDYFGFVTFKNDPIPIIAVPTTAGTGSEATLVAIVTDKENKIKLPIRSPQLLPKVVILDPTLLSSLPTEFIVYPGIDAFSHAIESFISLRSNLFTEHLSLTAIKLIYSTLIPFKENPKNTELGLRMLYGSYLAGTSFANASLTAVHALAHPIGSHYHLPHGLTCAFFLSRVLRENKDATLDKYVILYESLGFERKALSKEDCADRFIEAVEEFMKRLGVPNNLSSIGIKHKVLPEMIEDAMKSPVMLGNPKKLDRERIAWLFESIS